MAGNVEIWGKIAGAAIGVVGALAAVGLGFTVSRAWQIQMPPERVEFAISPIKPVLPLSPVQPKPSPRVRMSAMQPRPLVDVPKPAVQATLSPKSVAVSAHMEAAPPPAFDKRPAVAIVIDDLGADIPGTRRAMALPKAVTLSFLPYPDKSPELSHDGFCAGHEIILHMPMEPKGTSDPGPMALQLDLPKEEVQRRVLWAFSRVPDADGMNNHEGSWFTSDHKALIPVMAVLAQKHLFFLDSRTSTFSQGVKIARENGVPTAGRDVFLDDVVDSGEIAHQLGQVEWLARRKGLVIAIGHPHHQTLAALEAWIPEVEKQGYVLIPLSQAIKRRNAQSDDGASLSAPAQ